jgi:hypothetical protein
VSAGGQVGSTTASAVVAGGSDGVPGNNSFVYTANVGALTTLSLSSSANPSKLGQPLTLTATLGVPDTGGRVAFYDATDLIGNAAVSSGRAVLSTTGLPNGVRRLSARYSGGAGYGPISSGVLSQTVNALPGALKTPIAVSVPHGMTVMKAGDFNNDGRLDLVVSGLNQTSILLGGQDGSFQASRTVISDVTIREIAAGDFNQDGKLDLLAWRRELPMNPVMLLRGNGDGSFQSAVDLPLPASPAAFDQIGRLIVKDVNRDGALDIVCPASSTVLVWLNNGNGMFQIVSSPLPAYLSFELADMNGDDKPDVVVNELIPSARGIPPGRVQVLLGRGDGTFVSSGLAFASTSDYFLSRAVTGDFNGDGKVDVLQVVAQNRIAFFAGNGDGSLKPYVGSFLPFLNFSQLSEDITVADFNGDGRLDMGITSAGSVTAVKILIGDGKGSFGGALDPGVRAPRGAIMWGDFNLDGRPDFAVANWDFSPSGSIQVYLAGMAVANYRGYVDSVSCNTGISGWAADLTRPDQAILVTLWSGTTQIASALANLPRPDLASVLGDNGQHGFAIAIPAGYADGLRHTLQLRFESSDTQLSASPVTVTCGSVVVPNYTGYVDSASCATGITGWAADRNRPNQSIDVTLWNGSTQVASSVPTFCVPT